MRTDIVTGGARGLGLSIAKKIAKSNASEIVLAVRDVDRGAAVAEQY